MREGDLTYDDFLQRLNIQDVLIDAGYHLNRRDGLRYPSYVRLDSEGRRIRGDKFIVTQQGKCCFQAQQQKVYNIISFIKAHPQFFAEYPSVSISKKTAYPRRYAKKYFLKTPRTSLKRFYNQGALCYNKM